MLQIVVMMMLVVVVVSLGHSEYSIHVSKKHTICMLLSLLLPAAALSSLLVLIVFDCSDRQMCVSNASTCP